jgi:hypothetical protein
MKRPLGLDKSENNIKTRRHTSEVRPVNDRCCPAPPLEFAEAKARFKFQSRKLNNT